MRFFFCALGYIIPFLSLVAVLFISYNIFVKLFTKES